MKDKKLPYNTKLTPQESIAKHFEVNSKYSAQDLVDLGVSEEKMLEGYDVVDAPEEVELATSGTADPNGVSIEDNNGFLVRYKYTGNPAPQRSFCRTMMGAKKVYRREDIDSMSNNAVNPGFGLNGSNIYDIFLWKGGGMMSGTFPQGTCRHKWEQVIYKDKYANGKDKDITSKSKAISPAKAITDGAAIVPINPVAAVAPHNM